MSCPQDEESMNEIRRELDAMPEGCTLPCCVGLKVIDDGVEREPTATERMVFKDGTMRWTFGEVAAARERSRRRYR